MGCEEDDAKMIEKFEELTSPTELKKNGETIIITLFSLCAKLCAIPEKKDDLRKARSSVGNKK